MKITYIHQYFTTPGCAGGTRSYEFATRLVKDGHEVNIITTDSFFKQKSNNNRTWDFVEINGINVHICRSNYSNKQGFLSRIFSFLSFMILATIKGLRIKTDLIFATSTPLTIAIPAIIISKIKCKPFVFEIRDAWPDVPIAMGILKSKLIIFIARVLEKAAYINAKGIICLSPGMKDSVESSIGKSLKSIEIIPNGSDNELFDCDYEVPSSLSKEVHSIVKGKKLVIYAGTFGYVNGVDYIVEVAAHLKNRKDIAFLLIGDGIKKHEIIEKSKKLGVLDNNLYIHAPIPKNDLAKLLKFASLSLSTTIAVPELWNNSANKVFDSFAASVPVAINHKGWLAEILSSHKAGIILSENDCQEAAQMLGAYVSNEAKLYYARQASKKLALTIFSRDLLYNKFKRVLLNAAHPKG